MTEAVNIESLTGRIQSARDELRLVTDYIDPSELEAEVSRLEGEMQKPGFWDDSDSAAAVSSAHSRAQKKLDSVRSLETDVADLDDMVEMAESDSEIASELEEQLSSIETRLSELEEARLFSGPYDAGDAIVSVHAGAGGTDSQDWAEILLRMYLRWAEGRGFQVEMKEASEGDEAGLKSATFILRGENAYGLIAAERGVHRLVRISPFDSSSRRHTSFAQLDVAPMVDEDVEVEIEDADIRIDTYRASGAGGQHVNKTDSKVELVLDLLAVPNLPALATERLGPELRVVVQKHRSQLANLRDAEQLLLERLHEALQVEAPRIATRTPRSAERRRLADKTLHGVKKSERSRRDWD